MDNTSKKNPKSNNKNNDTSEDKKEKDDSMTKPVEWGKLAKSIAYTFVELSVLFIIGSRVVFAGKIAQFNILPTDIECMPYRPTSDDKESPKFQSTAPQANIDRLYVKSTEGYLAYATKIMTEITDKSRKNYLLDKLRFIEYDPQVSTPIKYIMVCLTNIFVFFYGITNAVYGGLNKYLNESLLIFLGPYILGLFMVAVLPLAIITTLIICILNFKWLFQENMNRDPDYLHKKKMPVWRDRGLFSSVYNFIMTIVYAIFGVLVVLNLSFTPVPIVIALYCFLSPLFMSAYIVDETADPEEKKKPYGFLGSVQGLLNTKLDLFMLIFAIYVVKATFKYGNVPAGIMVLLASLYFLYKQYTTPKKIPGIASGRLAPEEQNRKYCPKVRLTKKETMEIKRDETEAAEKAQKDYDESMVGKADVLLQDTAQDVSGQLEEAIDSEKTPSNNMELPVEGADTTPKGEAETVADEIATGVEEGASAIGDGVDAAGKTAESVGEGTEAVGQAEKAVGDVVEEGVDAVTAATPETTEPIPEPTVDTNPVEVPETTETTETTETVTPAKITETTETEAQPIDTSTAPTDSASPEKPVSTANIENSQTQPQTQTQTQSPGNTSIPVKKGGSLKNKFARKMSRATSSLKRRQR